jgi:hypothetical protein
VSALRTSTAAVLCGLAFSAFAAAPAGAAKPPRSFFGVAPQDTLNAGDFAALAQARVGTMRIGFYHQAVQQVGGKCQPKAQGGCTWHALDGIVGDAAVSGTRILPVLIANSPPLKGRANRRWKSFVTAAVKRYGPGGFFWRTFDAYGGQRLPITEWQVHNEPNSRQFWPGRPNAREYGRLLKATTRAIRDGHRKADVILAGMFTDALVPIRDYLPALYRVRGIERFFDSIALHPYARTIQDLKRQIRVTRGTAKRSGDRKVGITVTEMGWSSGRGEHPLMKGPNGQAKMLSRSFDLLARKRGKWKIDGVTWYALRDSNNRHLCKFCRQSGLLEVGGNPKPAFHAFQRATG